jgi:hypothetical protein
MSRKYLPNIHFLWALAHRAIPPLAEAVEEVSLRLKS